MRIETKLSEMGLVLPAENASSTWLSSYVAPSPRDREARNYRGPRTEAPERRFRWAFGESWNGSYHRRGSRCSSGAGLAILGDLKREIGTLIGLFVELVSLGWSMLRLASSRWRQ